MATGFELEGKIHLIDDIQTFSSGFSKREFVVEVQDGRFPQFIKFECLKEKAAIIDGFAAGDEVKVSFDIRGNEYKGRYFVNLSAWKLEKAGQAPGAAPPFQSSPSTDAGVVDDDAAPPSHLNEPPPGYGQDDENREIPF